MTDIPFGPSQPGQGATYAFKSGHTSGTLADRTMADRLIDTINVLDWGADPTFTIDSTTAIQNAINWAKDNKAPKGSKVFIPAGRYRIDTGPIAIGTLSQSDNTAMGLSIYGAGRDATILRGTLDTDYLLRKNAANAEQITHIGDFTVWNESVDPRSGGVWIEMYGAQGHIENMRFVAMRGLSFDHDGYNGSVNNCIFECSAPVGAANDPLQQVQFTNMVWQPLDGSGNPTPNTVLVTTKGLHLLPNGNNYLNVTAPAAWMPSGVSPGGQVTCVVGSGPIDSFSGGNFSTEQFYYTGVSSNPGAFVSGYFVKGAGPKAQSVGLYSIQSAITNCSAYGFDVGFAPSQVCTAILGCQAYRCNKGIYATLQPRFIINQVMNGLSIMGCTFDRCNESIYGGGAQILWVGNYLSGDGKGPPNYVTISNMQWSGGTVTVTTPAHNLTVGGGLHIITNNPLWTPDHTGDQNIEVTLGLPTTFTYSLGSDPGAFTGGTWGFPAARGIVVKGIGGGVVGAIAFNHRSYICGVDWTDFGNVGAYASTEFKAMRPRSGWFSLPIFGVGADNAEGGRIKFTSCGSAQSPDSSWPTVAARSNPIPFMKLAAAEVYDTRDYDIIDGQKESVGGGAAFGDNVVGGGSLHYKVRYNGNTGKFTRTG